MKGGFILFNKNISGFENEYEFCYKLNNKKVKDLDILHMEFIQDIYDNINKNDLIKAYVNKKKRNMILILK